MIGVEQIKIKVHMPSDAVRIVAMQPFIRFHSAVEEPFRWSDGAVGMQLAAIYRTLEIAQGGFGGRSANFTLFPEYAIPGIGGATIINNRISADEWPNESIIIAGIHGITKSEYGELCDGLAAIVSKANAPDSVPDDKWVNCCVIWIKDSEGVVQKWVQPKIRPAWLEMNVSCNDMFCGSEVYVFECQYAPSGLPCRFVTLICFDWIASIGGTTNVCHEFLEKLTELRTPELTPLDWVFVIQHNPNPNHPSFLNSTYQFLADANTHPFIERDKAAVVHANTAASLRPAPNGSGGFSACIFSPNVQFDCNSCRPTVSMQPSSLRKSNILNRCKDAVFREMGECIHAFTVRVPRFVIPDATDKTYPLPSAHVHATCETADPRLRDGSIPAAVKWLNDSLDVVEPLSATALAGRPLKAKAEAIEPAIIDAMRSSNGPVAAKSVNWAACSFSRGNESRTASRRINSDLWEADETDALEHVVHSLTALGLAYSLDFESTLLHGVVQSDGGLVQVIAIRGDTYQDCRLHYDKHITPLGTDPVLVIARDRDNLRPTPEEFFKIDESTTEIGLALLDYQTLITNCRNDADSDILKGHIDAFLPRHRRII